MTRTSKRLLFWSPRVICIAFAVFISLFALDVFNEHLSFWHTVRALAIHLLPTYIVIGVLVLAWRWEWIGTVAFAGLAALYFWFASSRHHPEWSLIISVPLLFLAGLFLANWMHRDELRART